MNIVVPIKLVPDLVEELEINDDATDLDRDFLTYRINEFDGVEAGEGVCEQRPAFERDEGLGPIPTKPYSHPCRRYEQLGFHVNTLLNRVKIIRPAAV